MRVAGLLLFSLVVAAYAGTIPQMSFVLKGQLQKAVNDKKCQGDDECIFQAVGDFLKERVNVIDCGFGGPEGCKKKGNQDLDACSLDVQPDDPGVVAMCKEAKAVGQKYRGCSLFAAFMGKALTPAQKSDPRCTGCKCASLAEPLSNWANQMIASNVFTNTWGLLGSTPSNQLTQKEHDTILLGLKDYWDAVVGNGRGVCATLAASLAFGARMMGVKGQIEWVKETYSNDGHEFVVYNREGSLNEPTGGKIFDAWYYLLGKPTLDYSLPLSADDAQYYDTSNWNPQGFGKRESKQKMLLVALDKLGDSPSGCYRKRGDDDADDDATDDDADGGFCPLPKKSAPKKNAPKKAPPKKAPPKKAPKKAPPKKTPKKAPKKAPKKSPKKAPRKGSR